jgi:serine/threonine protein kinase
MRKIGKYEVIKEIGSGGFGTVYLAQYKGIRYALKQLSRGVLETDISERFMRESLRVEELRKEYEIDYLIRVYDVLFKENAFVMEYIPEGSIEYMKKTGDEDFIISFIRAIRQLHGIGVAHRDIKPENLRVKDSKPVLIDFGVASWWDSRSNVVPVGTRYYSPPEMMNVFQEYRDLKAARTAFRQMADIIPDDARERIKFIKKIHDVYSLGITIGELLTGTIPFDKNSYTRYLEEGGSDSFDRWLEQIPERFREFTGKAATFYPLHRPRLDDLIKYLKIDTRPYTERIQVDSGALYFNESPYHCLRCRKTTQPPANYCPYCGGDLRYLALQIEPDQEVETANLPGYLKIVDNPERFGVKTVLIIDLNGRDFEITLGRKAGKSHIAFPDDNWISAVHGRLIKKNKKVYYSDGCDGKLPRNPGIINNIPVGSSGVELLSGAFLLLGSTIFQIKKYFGEYPRGGQAQ